MTFRRISAVTLAVRDMGFSIDFYDRVGFDLRYGGPDANFTSFKAGEGFLNLVLVADRGERWWGRVIFWVTDVNALYRRVVDRGLKPQAPPRDAKWGERFFHIHDPDGHELSFAQPLG